jgi:hypothetical protein
MVAAHNLPAMNLELFDGRGKRITDFRQVAHGFYFLRSIENTRPVMLKMPAITI